MADLVGIIGFNHYWTCHEDQRTKRIIGENFDHRPWASTTEGTVESNGGAHVVSSITSSSAEALKLEEGAEACAIIKSSSVMIGVADQVTPGS